MPVRLLVKNALNIPLGRVEDSIRQNHPMNCARLRRSKPSIPHESIEKMEARAGPVCVVMSVRE